MQLLFASHNQGKLKEAKAILASSGCQVVSLDDLHIDQDVAETGQTLAANAQLKADYYARMSGLITVADDSGLEIFSLAGWPGVNSHRIAEGSDEERIKVVLKKMVDLTDRQAQFRTVLCLVNPDQSKPQFFEGIVSGKITTQARGSAGFGYDPIFIPTGFTQTFAELGQDLKNKISHRQQALEKLKQYVTTHLSTSSGNFT